jgi:hypothetical protein
MKIDKALIHSYAFTIRPLSEADGGGFMIEYPDLMRQEGVSLNTLVTAMIAEGLGQRWAS